MSADASAEPSEFLAKLRAGSRLAGCYLLKKLVEGTAQPLWLAHDEVLDKDIALHMLPAGLLGRGDVADRLRQEVKHARQFVHPRVLRVQELIEEEEWAAIATESFTGQPLSAVIKANARGFFDIAEVWPLVRELCETLDDAHRINFVHGAMSPEDVLVGDGQAKLMNFGIAACVRGASEGVKSPFASPQQIAGAKATPADDVFALGALLHTLLAGAPPFAGAERKGAPSISEHRRSLKHQGGEVAENWERVIASCLAEDPKARPASCGEIAKQLDRGNAAASAVPAITAAVPTAPETKLPAAPEEQPAPAPVPVPASAPEPAVVPTPAPVVVPAPVVTSTPEPKVDEPSEPVKPPKPQPEPSKPAREPQARVPEHEVAEKVRREEAEEEARALPRNDEDEFYDHSHASKPSTLTMVIIVAFIGLVCFISYRVFFADSGSKPSRTVVDVGLPTPTPTPQPTPLPATPTPKPVAKVQPATPTPAPATPEPTPVVAPKPMAQAEPPKSALPEGDAKEIEAVVAEMKLTRDKAAKELPAAKKEADELAAQQLKLAEDVKKAEAAAQEAEKAAAERKKVADEARKATAAASEQIAAKKAEIAKVEERLARLETDLKEKEEALRRSKASAEAPKKTSTGAMPAPESVKPVAAEKPVTSPAPAPSDDPRLAFEQKMKELSKVLDSSAKPATPAPEAAKPEMEVAKASTPEPGKATNDAADGLINSLGMRMKPLPGSDVLVCIWPTRVRDFEVFAKTAGLKSTLWKDPGFKQGPDHPVVNVTWQEANAFCKWLTQKEQKEGTISAKQSYRLLTDLEWSRAAGLGAEAGSTPESRDMGVPDVYPWGKVWPPPVGAGNYTGEETGSDVAIKGYNDGFPWTSPVGSFPANKLGFFDMGGNVWQWCMDSWNAESKAKVLRGASWYNGALKLSLLTSCRVHASPDSSTDNYGFRIALSGTDSKTGK